MKKILLKNDSGLIARQTIAKRNWLRAGSHFMCLFMLMLVFASCEEKNQEVDGLQGFIEAVETVSPKAANIQVDNFGRKIELDYVKFTDLSAVQIKLTLGEGVELVEPANSEASYNLTEDPVIKLKCGGQNLTYRFEINYLIPDYDPSSKGWVKSDEFGELPDYLTLYKAPKTYNGKNVIGYIAVADMNNPDSKFSVLGEDRGYKTPSQFYESSEEPAIVMNAGYFWDGYALGLVARDGKVIREGNPMVWRTLNGETKIYYPTQAAFGYDESHEFSANWVYTNGGITYAYPSPAPNKSGTEPMPVPSSSYPDGAVQWNPSMAVGAGPMLVKDGVYYNTWESEMLGEGSGIGATINNPRSAIGITKYGYLIFFVCEGRNQTPETPGLTLEDEANIMLELGCVDAINLDGGGSSCMLVNGKEIIKLSDGHQRKVVTAVALY